MSDLASVYTERNKCTAGLAFAANAAGWRVGLAAPHDAEPGWSTAVFIDLPTGQASWHIPDAELHFFDGLPSYPNKWDGHSTEEKYARVLAMGQR